MQLATQWMDNSNQQRTWIVIVKWKEAKMIRNIIETFIIMLFSASFIFLVFSIIDLQNDVQSLNSYKQSHNTRLNKLEQFEFWRLENCQKLEKK